MKTGLDRIRCFRGHNTGDLYMVFPAIVAYTDSYLRKYWKVRVYGSEGTIDLIIRPEDIDCIGWEEI